MSDDLFRLVIAGGVALAALCFLGLTVTMWILLRTVNRLKENIEPLSDKTGPILDVVRSSAKELIPRRLEISTEAIEIFKSARQQVNRVGEVGKKVWDRCMAQQGR